LAACWSPIGLFWGRLSVNLEVQLAPHHALVASPNVIVFSADRGGPTALLSEGFGFVTRDSFSIGGELGYHYWVSDARVLRGVFVGPSALFGATTLAAVGDASHAQGYYGLAVDLGVQEVLAVGFTVGAGVGGGLLHMASTTAVVPRFLAQAGWSF
jgi:hypothetical protein